MSKRTNEQEDLEDYEDYLISMGHEPELFPGATTWAFCMVCGSTFGISEESPEYMVWPCPGKGISPRQAIEITARKGAVL